MLTKFYLCSDAGTNSTALSSGANSPQLERHIIPAMSRARQVRAHPETVASPQYQVANICNNMTHNALNICHNMTHNTLFSLTMTLLRSDIPAWMSARDGKLTTPRWDMRR